MWRPGAACSSEALLTLRIRHCVRGWGDKQRTGCFLLKCWSICFRQKAAFVLPGVYGLIKWSVILMVFTHFIFIICSVLILNTNCYACSNTLNVAKKFAGWDKNMCVVVVVECNACVCVCVFTEARLAPPPRKKRHVDRDRQTSCRKTTCSWKNSCQVTVSSWFRLIVGFKWRKLT